MTIKSKISYSEKSSISLVILAIAFIFEQDLVEYELVYARCIILKVISLVKLDLQFQLTLSNKSPPQMNIYLAVIENFIFTEYLSVSCIRTNTKNEKLHEKCKGEIK